MSVPASLRCHFTTENCTGVSTSRSGSWNRSNSNRKRGIGCDGSKKNVVDLISHLCGKQVPGIPANTSLPSDKKERLQSILWIYSSLLTFLRCQGAMVAAIKPENLLDIADFHYYCNFVKDPSTLTPGTKGNGESASETGYEMRSRKAWCDLLLQVIKVFVLAKITPQSYKKIPLPPCYPPLPAFNPDPLCSNVYSISERILLAWLNCHYEQQRLKCWKQKKSGVKPPSRWIVNFENDFVDGLVLASLLCAYAPYLASDELSDLHTQPNSAEQCLHNALKVVNGLKKLGLDYDVMATDITEPNSISILLLCAYLYQRLPFYLPSKTVEFTGTLFSTVTKHIKLHNPSNKPIIYNAVLAGKYSNDFSIPQGEQIQVPAKGNIEVAVEFKSRFLRECECTLILVGKRIGSAVGSTLAFTLNGVVQNIQPMKIIKCKSPCYELRKIHLSVKNPFAVEGSFKMVLVETDTPFQSKDQSSISLAKKNQKKVNSRTDHGQNRKSKNNGKEELDMLKDLVIEDKTPKLSAFWSPDGLVQLGPYATSNVEIQFLPFDLGAMQCSVLFLNEQVGEFLYSIEAESILPLPTEVPFFYDEEGTGDKGKHGSRVTSAMAVHHSQGLLQEDNSIIYLHCEAEKESIEELNLPVHNYARGKALRIATEQRMSDKEIRRREKTGITSAETVLEAISCLQMNRKADYKHPSELLGITGAIQEFSVEMSSPYFECQSSISIPVDVSSNSMEETIKLPITVLPCEPGQYNCLVILKSTNDIRVYRIECTMKQSNSEVEIEFTTPAHQSVVQGVPVVNHSDLDWNLNAFIDGEGFTGPPSFTAYAQTTTSYPLCFQPVYEGAVKGKLTMKNGSNGAENEYYLKGLSTKPLPIDDVYIDCIVNEPSMKVLEVTNKMPYKMVFQAFSDLDMITGPPFITVLPQQTAAVPFNILTQKRGSSKGVISFVYDAEFVKEMGLDKVHDVDSDDDDYQNDGVSNIDIRPFLSDNSSCLADLTLSRHFQRPYHLWYAVHINSIPNEPIKCLEAQAAVNSSSTLELLLKNPKKEELNLDVIIDGLYLYGEASVTVKSFSSAVYQLQYIPFVTGKTKASVIFQSDCCTEFWYDILLTADNPVPKQLPMMQCTLGKSCTQNIRLSNPSVQPIIYDVACNNTNNFQIGTEEEMTVTIPALTDIEVPLIFVPTSLGSQDHKAEIIFFNETQGSCVTYHVMGVADKPMMADKYLVQAEIGANSSIIILFQNPFLHDILVDVALQEMPSLKDKDNEDGKVFGLLLKNCKNIFLPAKTTLDIPVAYAPDRMRKQEALCTVFTEPYVDKSLESNLNLGILNNKVNWTYEIDGIPICIPVKNSHAPTIQCRARERANEKVEITFVGSSGEFNRANHAALMKSMSPIHLLGEYNPPSKNSDYEEITESYDYCIESLDPGVEEEISRAVAVQLKRKTRHRVSNLVSLLFEVVFASSKMFNHLVYFVITSTSGAVWKYPIRFSSTEPLSDDVIVMKSLGLNKESKVAFRLVSQTSDLTQFEAFFANGYDDMFTVSPPSGMLLPDKDGGTLFTVTYKPKFYGKTHRAKLMIQTRDFQWIYDIKGETPEYTPPRTNAAIESHLSSAHQSRGKRRNYVCENLKINNTAVSSPLKVLPKVSH